MGEVLIDAEVRYARGPTVRASATLARAPVTVLLGPSGAGKTTILRCLAGLERPASGRIAVDGQTWFDAGRGVFVPPHRRRVGYVPQEPDLFPHLSVRGNIAYGLPRRPAPARAERIAAMASLAGLAGLERRRPRELSGGQRQRLALARALAPGPRLLLLDEPLASLDPAARESLGRDLRGLILRSGVPAIVVTHDRAEALALGDEVAVVAEGRLRQTGPVAEVFSRPADAAVAAAVGVETVAPGRVLATADDLSQVRVGAATLTALNPGAISGDVLVCIRAEDVVLRTEEESAVSARNRLRGRVVAAAPAGPLVRVDVDCGFALAALVTRVSVADLALAPGREVTALVKAPDVHLVPRSA